MRQKRIAPRKAAAVNAQAAAQAEIQKWVNEAVRTGDWGPYANRMAYADPTILDPRSFPAIRNELEIQISSTKTWMAQTNRAGQIDAWGIIERAETALRRLNEVDG
jgi:hypothetical protein